MVKHTERIQRRATKYILNLPFRCDTNYQQRLLLLDLIPLCYWHEFLDIVLFYKLTHGHVSIDTDLLPSPKNINRRKTRSSDPDHLTFTTKRCKTTTYQKSYLNRVTRLWNILPRDLTGKNISLTKLAVKTFTMWRIRERGNLYVCPVTCVVTCPVIFRVVIDFKCLCIICLWGRCNWRKL